MDDDMNGGADTIITGGRIWTGLDTGFVEALAISGDKIMAAGPRADIERLRTTQTRRIDLAGRLAIPGLNDAHLHLHIYGLTMQDVDLSPERAATVDALLALIGERARTAKPGEWVKGRGYDHNKLAEQRHPTRAELDAVAPDNPIYVARNCGHVGVANSKALALAGIGVATPDPEGGRIGRENGKLTGFLAESARQPVLRAAPSPTLADLVDAIERAGKDLLSHGITSAMEAAIGLVVGYVELDAYLEARRLGRLPLRITGCLMGDKSRSIIDQAAANGHITGAGDDMFRIGPVKIFTDGSASAGTAAMSVPYENTDDTGVLCLGNEDCEALVLKAHGLGYQMAVHAIGDVAIGQVLTAYEKAQSAVPAPGRRHRVEHCGWLTGSQLARMQALDVLPAPQPAFIYYSGDAYVRVLGQQRSDFCYPMRAFIHAGLHPSASTDCPVSKINPFANIYAMLTRKSDGGTVLGGDQVISLEQALHAYTYESAYGAHDETRKGRLVPGQYADIAILSRDLFTATPEELLDTQCDMTLLGGRTAFERTGATHDRASWQREAGASSDISLP